MHCPDPLWEQEGCGNFKAIFSHPVADGRASGTLGLLTGVGWEEEGLACRTKAAGLILAPRDEALNRASRPPGWRSEP